MASDEVITVHGERELAARAGHLFGAVRTEFICAATDMDTWSRPAARDDVGKRTRASIAGGVTVRKLYTTAALAVEVQRLHLTELAAAGARVRICPAPLPHETIIIDRRVMILAGAVRDGDREFGVTTSRTLIDGVYALFEATWDAARSLDDHLRRDLRAIGPAEREILRLLADGLTDEAGARRAGVSLRTYRRRVAELMKLLDSESRYQAGVHAGRMGLS